jgi:hypothetical protein
MSERAPGEPICGALHNDEGIDCFCFLPPHPADELHECAAVGCGRQWTSKTVGRAA